MNSSGQSLSHLFIKFTVYSLFFHFRFMMNDTLSSIKLVKLVNAHVKQVHTLIKMAGS
jgi:hypothetical protein